jgi:2-keto-4-pentenoate hydratase
VSNVAEDLAQRIARDIREQNPFRLSGSIGTDLARAYAVQDKVTLKLMAHRPGRSIGGYKLAFNKQASFDYYGISEPCSAPVFADRIFYTGAELQLDAYRQLVIEPEIAVVLGEELPLSGVTPEQAHAAISHYVAAFELLDVRDAFALDPSAAEAVAQGVYNAGAVLGETRLQLNALDLATLPVRLALDDDEPLQAVGAAPQHPVDAVCWLANHLGARGQMLRAGMILLCGTHLPAQTLTQRAAIRLDMGPLGEIALQVS